MGEFTATTVFRAIKKPNGQVVVIDIDYLLETTKVVRHEADYLMLKGLGWTDDPQSAMDRFEHEEEDLGRAAAERALQDSKMSPLAQAEAEAYESIVPGHVPVIPELTRKRGRPKKIVEVT